MVRRLLLAVAITGLTLCNAGCFIPIYSNQPLERMNELLNTSEDLRQIRGEWERIWFVDQPSHLTYERIHGGIQ
jgi:hypothetical protein